MAKNSPGQFYNQGPQMALNSEECKKLLQNFISMFGEAVETPIIYKVLQNHNWDVEESIEELIKLNSESNVNVHDNQYLYSAEKEFEKIKIDEICQPPQCQDYGAFGFQNTVPPNNLKNNFDDKPINGLENIKIVYKGEESGYDETDADVIIEEENEYEINNGQNSLPSNSVDLPLSLPNPNIYFPKHHVKSQNSNSLFNSAPVFNTENRSSPADADRSDELQRYRKCLNIYNTIERITQLVLNGIKVLVILRGCPGSGKSFTADRLIMKINENRRNSKLSPMNHIYSTDDYFLTKSGYNFDSQRLSDAHEWNRKRVWKAITKHKNPIVVDNTNTQAWEMKPYVEMGVAFGYIVEILEPENKWKWKEHELSRRNIHSVPRSRIRSMLERFERDITTHNILQVLDLQYCPPNLPPQFVPNFEDLQLAKSPKKKSKLRADGREENYEFLNMNQFLPGKNNEVNSFNNIDQQHIKNFDKNNLSYPFLQNEVRSKDTNSRSGLSSPSLSFFEKSNTSQINDNSSTCSSRNNHERKMKIASLSKRPAHEINKWPYSLALSEQSTSSSSLRNFTVENHNSSNTNNVADKGMLKVSDFPRSSTPPSLPNSGIKHDNKVLNRDDGESNVDGARSSHWHETKHVTKPNCVKEEHVDNKASPNFWDCGNALGKNAKRVDFGENNVDNNTKSLSAFWELGTQINKKPESNYFGENSLDNTKSLSAFWELGKRLDKKATNCNTEQGNDGGNATLGHSVRDYRTKPEEQCESVDGVPNNENCSSTSLHYSTKEEKREPLDDIGTVDSAYSNSEIKPNEIVENAYGCQKSFDNKIEDEASLIWKAAIPLSSLAVSRQAYDPLTNKSEKIDNSSDCNSSCSGDSYKDSNIVNTVGENSVSEPVENSVGNNNSDSTISVSSSPENSFNSVCHLDNGSVPKIDENNSDKRDADQFKTNEICVEETESAIGQNNDVHQIAFCKDFVLIGGDGSKVISRDDHLENTKATESIEGMCDQTNNENKSGPSDDNAMKTNINDGVAVVKEISNITEEPSAASCAPTTSTPSHSILKDLFFSELKDDPVDAYFTDEEFSNILKSQNEDKNAFSMSERKEMEDELLRIESNRLRNNTDFKETAFCKTEIDMSIMEALINADENLMDSSVKEMAMENLEANSICKNDDSFEESAAIDSSPENKQSAESFVSCPEENSVYFDVQEEGEKLEEDENADISESKDEDAVGKSKSKLKIVDVLSWLTKNEIGNDSHDDSNTSDESDDNDVNNSVEDTGICWNNVLEKSSPSEDKRNINDAEPKRARSTLNHRVPLINRLKQLDIAEQTNARKLPKELLNWDSVQGPYTDWFSKVKDTIGTTTISNVDKNAKPQRSRKNNFSDADLTYNKGNVTVLGAETSDFVQKESESNLKSDEKLNQSIGTNIVNILGQTEKHEEHDSNKKTDNSEEVCLAKEKLKTLTALFPQSKEVYLQELLKQCQGDINWAAEILLEEGCEMAGQHYDITGPPSPKNDEHNVNLVECPELKPSGTIPKRSTRKEKRVGNSSSEASLELKRSIEQSVVLNESNYSDHVLKLIKARKGEDVTSVSPISYPETQVITDTFPDEQNVLPEAWGSCNQNVEEVLDNNLSSNTIFDQEDETLGSGVSHDEEGTVEYLLNRDLVSALHRNFGSPGLPLHMFDIDCAVKLPISLARQLHSYMMDTMEEFIAVEEESMQNMIREDEEFARRLQEEEEEQRGAEERTCDAAPPPQPGLQEIIDMEIALAIYRADQENERDKRESNATIATRLAKTILVERFPNIDQQVLFELLSSNNNSLHNTIAVLQMSQEVEPDLYDWEKQLLEKAKAESMKDNDAAASGAVGFSSDGAIMAAARNDASDRDQAIVNWEYCRDEARKHFDIRNEFFQKAQKAYSAGNKVVASYYSQMANLHMKKFDQANCSAATMLLSTHTRSETEVTLDLHFYQVREAMQILDIFLDASISRLLESQKSKNILYIITGRGLHSADGKSKIKPAVMKRLRVRQIKCDMMSNPGMLKCVITRNSVLSSAQ